MCSTHRANSLESSDMHGTSRSEIDTRLKTGTAGLDIVLHPHDEPDSIVQIHMVMRIGAEIDKIGEPARH